MSISDQCPQSRSILETRKLRLKGYVEYKGPRFPACRWPEASYYEQTLSTIMGLVLFLSAFPIQAEGCLPGPSGIIISILARTLN